MSTGEGQKDLGDAIDEAAVKLLLKSSGSGSLSDADGKVFPEQVKAFAAVVDWFKIKHGVSPASTAPTETKFGQLKRQFNGDSASSKRRRGRPAAKNATGSADGGDDPGDGTAGAGGT